MGAVNWAQNEKFIENNQAKVESVNRIDWIGFLDALGKVEGKDAYSADNKKGYVGIYQFSSFDNPYSIFKTLDFSNNIGAMLGVISDEGFKANPIAQELGALMEFSGVGPSANAFVSSYRYTRNAAPVVGFSAKKFDQMVGRKFTVQWTDGNANAVGDPQEITLTEAGISTATHLVGQGGVAYAMRLIYDQAYTAKGDLKSPLPTIRLGVNESIQLKSDRAYVADGNGIAFSTYVMLFSKFNISPLLNATDAQFNQLAQQLIGYRKDKILAYLEDTDGALSMATSVGSTSFRETIHAVINGLELQLPLDYLDRTNGDLVVGFSSGTTLVGSGQDDLIFGQGGHDTLVGQSGDDVLYGGTGNDTLKGDTGSDIYVFEANEGRDTIQDADGVGFIRIGGAAGSNLAGADLTQSVVDGRTTWTSSLEGVTYTLMSGSLDTGADIRITGAPLGSGSITIKDFTITDDDPSYLGIRLKDNPEIDATTHGDTLQEGGAKTVKLDLNSVVDTARTIIVRVQGAITGALEAILGDETVPFTDGEIELTLAPGQSEVSFGLLSKGDVDTDQTFTLSASLLKADGTVAATDNLTLNFDATDEASGPPATTRDIVGGYASGTDDLGNPYTGTYDESRADTLYDSTGNDHVMAGGGGDVVTAWRGGDDFIEAGDGIDWVDAGGGNDLVLGGDGLDALWGNTGDDRLYAGATEVSFEQAIADGETAPEVSGDGEWLIGGDGADLLVGANTGDVLEGGAGADRLVGSGGGEFIDADGDVHDLVVGEITTLMATSDVDADGGMLLTFEIESGPGVHVDATAPGEDVVYGGAGDDYVRAGGGDDYVDAGTGADVVAGDAGDDVILGGDGNDTLSGDNGGSVLDYAEHGDDFLDGGAGDDKLWGDGGADSLFGGDGDDQLVGDTADANAGDDYLDGEAGDDILAGGMGADTLFGGDGDDQLAGDLSGHNPSIGDDDYLDGEAGDDLLIGQGGDDEIIGGDGNDQLQGEDGNDSLEGDTGDDKLFGGSGEDSLEGGDGNDLIWGDNGGTDTAGDADVLYGGSGDDQLVGQGGDDTLYGEEGVDTIIGGLGGDAIYGGEGNDAIAGDNGGADNAGDADTIDGGAGDDLLMGQGGDDSIVGGDGIDMLFGGDGNDVLKGGAGDDSLQGDAGNDLLDGGDGFDVYRWGFGDGIDTVSDEGYNALLFGFTFADSGLELGVGSLLLTFAGHDGDAIHLEGFDPLDPYTNNTGIAQFQFSDGVVFSYQQLIDHFGFTFEGTPDADVLEGTGASDQIDALEGDDVVTGEAGSDAIYLDAGDDYADAGDGSDQVYGDEGDDTILLGADDDAGFGGDGADFIDGGAGGDYMVGGSGDDTYVVDDYYDEVHEAAGGGIDTVEVTSFGFILPDNVENATLVEGSVAFVATGNDLDNTLVGNSAPDQIDGGAGDDLMLGGAGDDYYVVDSAGDQVVELADEGRDEVQTFVDCALGDNVEDLTLIPPLGYDGPIATVGQGNALDNTIRGNDGDNELYGEGGNDRLIDGYASNDLLDGGTGADYMSGGEGNDYYVVDDAGDVVDESPDLYFGGYDAVESSIDFALPFYVEDLYLTGATGTENLSGVGNDLSNEIDGNDGDNLLWGAGGDDYLWGGAGNDSLDGGAGADYLEGGSGDDSYSVDDAGDEVDEAAGAGTDSVTSSIDYELSSNVENLTLAGDSAIVAAGNQLDNLIVGNAADNELYGFEGNDRLLGNGGNDLLDGGTGADFMAGGAGGDAYIVDDAGDNVFEDDGDATMGGVDLVESNVDYTLTANVENLSLVGDTFSEELSGTGNELDNVIVGNDGDNSLAGLAGNDTLDGGAGADFMAGGAGDDSYIVDNDGDVTLENADEGYDTAYSSVTHTLGDNLDALYLTGTDSIDGTGNELDNLIVGNDGDNVLTGLAGDDTIDGGAGSDVMVGGAGDDLYHVDWWNDQVIEALGEGHDRIESETGYALGANVEDLTLLGDLATDLWQWDLWGDGNELDNRLIGNDGSNYLTGFAGDDLIDGRAGGDRLYGGDGSDNLRGGDDAVYSASSVNELGQFSHIDVIALNDDYLQGDAGNDSLDGGSGDDSLYGGNGNDVLYGGDDGASIVGDRYFEIVGYEDPTRYYMAGTGDEAQALAEQFAASSNEPDYWFVQEIGGYEGTLFLTNDDYLDGGAGDDLLDGGSGNDDLYGGDGNDTLHGGADGPLNTSNRDTLYGGAGNDSLYGGSDHDWLDGGDGMDYMAGGTGNDTYFVDGTFIETTDSPVYDDCGDLVPGAVTRVWTTDTVVENANEGFDTVYSSADYALPDDVEQLTLVNGSAARIGRGNALDNTINGNDFDNRLEGGEGDDYLSGGQGNDVLVGGAGDDVLVGGLGDDVYNLGVASGHDVVYAGDGGADSVHVVDDVTVDDITLSRLGDDVVIALNGTHDRMVLANWFASTNRVRQIEFCDGSTLDETAIASLANSRMVDTSDDFAAVAEDGVDQAAGNVLDNDTDTVAGETLSIAEPGVVAGQFGTLTISVDGTYMYSLDNAAVQYLAEGETATDGIAYEADDSGGAYDIGTLNVAITGQNDAPAIDVAGSNGAVVDNATATVVTLGDSLVVNGGFETGDFQGWTLSGDTWGAGVDSYAPHGGSYEAYFGGGGAGTGLVLSQEIPTVAGQHYLLDYSLMGGGDSGARFTASWNGMPLSVLSNTYDPSYADYRVEVVGTGGASVLQFTLRDDYDYWSIDDVSVGTVTIDEVIPSEQITSGTLSFADVDLNDSHALSVSAEGADYLGSFDASLAQDSTGGATGSVAWNFGVANDDIRYLGEGETLSQYYDVAVDDGHAGGVATQWVTVNIVGANEAPTIDWAEASGEVTEDAPVDDGSGNLVVPAAESAFGEIDFSDIDLSDVHGVTVAAHEAGYVGSLSATVSGDSTGSGSGWADWTFSVDNAAIDSLAEGEVLEQDYDVSVDDGHGGIATQTVTVDINGANDAPLLGAADAAGTVAANATAPALIEGDDLLANGGFESGDFSGWSLSGNTGYAAVDAISYEGTFGASIGAVGAPSVLSQDVATVAGDQYVINFWLQGGGAGGVNFNADWNGQSLMSLGDATLDDFTEYRFVVDGADGISHLQFTAQNDPDYWYLDDVTVARLMPGQVVPEVQATSGTITFSDVDMSDEHFIDAEALGTGYVGSFDAQLVQDSTGGAAGSVAWTFSVDNAVLAALDQGETLTQTYEVTIDDDHAGGTATQTVTVTLAGPVDQPPVTADDAASVQEDATLVASGSVLANDFDPEGGQLAVVESGTFVGAYGTLTLNGDGSYDYLLDNTSAAVQGLREGEAVGDSFSYAASDDNSSTPGTLVVSVLGTNDAPLALADSTALQEDAVPSASGNVLANDSDVDAGTVLGVVNAGTFVGAYGTLTLNGDGSYDYLLDNSSEAVQGLNEGEAVSDTFTYAASDGSLSTAGTLNVIVVGANDAPATLADGAAVQEDAAPSASGNVLANDSDIDHDTLLSVANPGSYAGVYGTLDLAADGSYSFALANGSFAVQSLAQGQTVLDGFDYAASDGVADTASQLTISVAGRNDAPVLVTPIDDQQALAGSAFSVTLADGTFADIDAEDVLAYSAALADGTPLPAWLSFDAATRTFTGMPGTVDVGALEIQLTATDLAGATTSDSFSLAIVGGDDQLDYSADSVWPQCEADCGPGGDDDNDGHDGHGRDDDDGGNCISERINAGSPGVAGTGDAVDLSGRNRSYGVYDGGAGFDTLNGTDGDDALLLDDDASPRPDGTSGPRLISIEAIDMGAGDDVVDLTSVRYDYGNVAIAGGAGNDVLWSNAGNDQLDGGAGNDQLEAGAGDDVYLHGPNGGADVVLDTGGQDAIQFADGIDAASVSVARSHNDLVLSAGANGSVTVQDWFASGDARVEQVQFADGTVWGESELSARAAAHGGDHHGGGGGDGGCPPGHGDDHHDRGDAEHAGASSSPDARDKHDKRDERDPLADILRRAPHYDFAALTDYLALHEARSDGPLTAEQIAQRWTQVRGSVARLGDNDPYARDGVLDGDSLDGDLAHAGLMNAGWGHSGSTGQVRGAGGLPTLRGLNEGFRRLG